MSIPVQDVPDGHADRKPRKGMHARPDDARLTGARPSLKTKNEKKTPALPSVVKHVLQCRLTRSELRQWHQCRRLWRSLLSVSKI